MVAEGVETGLVASYILGKFRWEVGGKRGILGWSGSGDLFY